MKAPHATNRCRFSNNADDVDNRTFLIHTHPSARSGWSSARFAATFSLSLAFLLSLFGCAMQENETEQLKHVSPPHKPKDFSQCVDQLQQRGTQFFDGSMSDSELTELNDVINWLPELAADSDLKRGQWESVQSMVPQLERLLRDPANAETRALWMSQVVALQELVPLADTWDQYIGRSSPVADAATLENSLPTTAEEPSRD